MCQSSYYTSILMHKVCGHANAICSPNVLAHLMSLKHEKLNVSGLTNRCSNHRIIKVQGLMDEESKSAPVTTSTILPPITSPHDLLVEKHSEDIREQNLAAVKNNFQVLNQKYMMA